MKKTKLRGSKRMKEMGNKLVQVWLDVKEADELQRAADRNGIKLATMIREMAVEVAREFNLKGIDWSRMTYRD